MAKCYFCGASLSEEEGSINSLNEKTGEYFYKKRSSTPGADPPLRHGEFYNFIICENGKCLNEFLVTLKGSKNKSKSGNGKCYIATASYGYYNAPEVLIFREFRDKYLLKNSLGKSFVRFYYKNSPYWADKLKKHLFLNKIIKKIFLDTIYKILK